MLYYFKQGVERYTTTLHDFFVLFFDCGPTPEVSGLVPLKKKKPKMQSTAANVIVVPPGLEPGTP